jgi:hypothetical protein
MMACKIPAIVEDGTAAIHTKNAIAAPAIV